MTSKWLTAREREYNSFCAQKEKLGPMTAVMAFFIFIVFLIMTVINGQYEYLGPASMLTIAAIMLLICLAVAIMFRHGRERTDISELREHLSHLLSTSEQFEQFDREMLSPPLYEVPLKNADGECFFTEHYMVRSEEGPSGRRYHILYLNSIHALKTAYWKDRSSFAAMDREYMIIFLDKDKNSIEQFSLKGRKRMQDFLQALFYYAPHISKNT